MKLRDLKPGTMFCCTIDKIFPTVWYLRGFEEWTLDNESGTDAMVSVVLAEGVPSQRVHTMDADATVREVTTQEIATQEVAQ